MEQGNGPRCAKPGFWAANFWAGDKNHGGGSPWKIIPDREMGREKGSSKLQHHFQEPSQIPNEGNRGRPPVIGRMAWLLVILGLEVGGWTFPLNAPPFFPTTRSDWRVREKSGLLDKCSRLKQVAAIPQWAGALSEPMFSVPRPDGRCRQAGRAAPKASPSLRAQGRRPQG